MNAIKAKRMTEENLKGKLPEEQYKCVKQDIQNDVNSGRYSYWVDGTLYESVKERLRSEGFKVSNNFLKDLGGTTISWK